MAVRIPSLPYKARSPRAHPVQIRLHSRNTSAAVQQVADKYLIVHDKNATHPATLHLLDNRLGRHDLLRCGKEHRKAGPLTKGGVDPDETVVALNNRVAGSQTETGALWLSCKIWIKYLRKVFWRDTGTAITAADLDIGSRGERQLAALDMHLPDRDPDRFPVGCRLLRVQHEIVYDLAYLAFINIRRPRLHHPERTMR